MRSSVFEPHETAILLKAQEIAIEEASKRYFVTDVLKWKIADVVLRLGRRHQKAGTAMDAALIASDAVAHITVVMAPQS